MKRFWLVLLSLGLVMAFSASAFAVDVKFSGSYYAAGVYLDNTSFTKKNTATTYWAETDLASGTFTYAQMRTITVATLQLPANGGYSAADAAVAAALLYPTGTKVKAYGDGTSSAFYFQRMRVQTEFVASPGLKLVTRFDAMERAWGAARSNPYIVDPISAAGGGTAPDRQDGSAGTAAENENIVFDWAYISWLSPIGLFNVGYQDDGTYGTVFGDSSTPVGKIQFVTKLGNVIAGGNITKTDEWSKGSTGSDRDNDTYVAFVNYIINKDSEAGLLYAYKRIAQYRDSVQWALQVLGFTAKPVKANVHVLNAYAKGKMGPVKAEAEVMYLNGKGNFENGLIGRDVDLGMLTGYVSVTADMGPVYFGAKFAYMSGDKPDTTDKWEGGQIGGGWDWNPCLILFNFDRTFWAGSITGYAGDSPNSTSGLFGAVGMTNAWFYQGVIGVNPTAALNIQASLAYANADQVLDNAAGKQEKPYGWEFDITGTYKITNNLSYMLGVGYLITGDYYKGYVAVGDTTARDLKNNYLVINKLSLTF